MTNASERFDRLDFNATHQALRRYVDANVLAGVVSAVLVGREQADLHCVGWADKEQKVPLRSDHIFRVFSNTKMVTSCAAMLLMEEGRFRLDDPVENFLPQLAHRQVLRPGATRIDDVEKARGPITIRHLLTHSAGLSYGLLDPGTTIFKAYKERRILDPSFTLAEMVDRLADLPLVFEPGTGFEYSVAADVVARLIEVISGQAFDAFLQARILGPLGMVDTGFVVPAGKLDRLAANYFGASPTDPMAPGLNRADDAPWPKAFVRPVPLLSGGAGLVSTAADMLAFMLSLMPGGPTLLKPETLALMMTNQLPEGVRVKLPVLGELKGLGFGIGGSVTVAPGPMNPPDSTGEFEWRGLAGTHVWISPRKKLSGLLLTQRFPCLVHPFQFEFKRLVYDEFNRRR